jgi:uncharacterized protein YjcR
MAKLAGPPWARIKKEYLEGVPPRDLGRKYGIKAKSVSDKARREGWVRKKSDIIEKIAEKVEYDLTELKARAVKELELIAFTEIKKTKINMHNKMNALTSILNLCSENEKNQKAPKKEIPEDIKSLNHDELMESINQYLDE